MTWSRRDLLRLVATSAAAPVVAPLIQACGGAQRGSAGLRARPERALDNIHVQVRAAVNRLSRHFASASGYVVRNAHGRAFVDNEGKGVDTQTTTSLVLTVTTDDARYERSTTDLSEDGINLAELQLRQRSPTEASAPAPAMVPSQQFAAPVDIDPRALTPQDWLAALEKLFARSQDAGDSRIVYRGAYLLVDDADTIFIATDRDLRQRLVRTRAGVQFIAWTGNQPVVDEASHAGCRGLEVMRISKKEMAAAARRALALLTARAGRTFDTQVVLDPSITGLLARDCLGSVLRADRWVTGEVNGVAHRGKRIGSEHVTVIDDPGAPGLYGSYFFDDEGTRALRTTLVDKGILQGPLTDAASAAQLRIAATGNGRRRHPLEPARPHFSNLSFGPGASSREQLIERVDRGLLVEGGISAQIDPHTWQLVVRVSRALELRDGKLTGKLFGGMDLVGDLRSLLGAVRAVSREVVYRIDDGELAAAAGGPHLLTRAKLVAA